MRHHTAFGSRRSVKLALAIPTSLAVALTLSPAPAMAERNLSSSGFTDSLRPKNAPERTPLRTEFPKIAGLPAGVSVDRVEYLGDRHIKIFINSAAMPGKPIPVQVLLARDWYSNPKASFPQLWALDGMRAIDKESGWTIETDIQQFYADKNINVVMPVGGESSFYSDWEQPDNGKNYKWETFLTQELAAVMKEGFRSTDDRAIVGLSMGGTGAMNIAEHRPDLFRFVGSFSGYLDTSSSGMPPAIAAAVNDAGGYDATKMWGPFYSQGWIDHDPKLGIEALKNMTVYVSAGSGRAGNDGDRGNYAGQGLEVLSRLTSQTFVNRARDAGVPVIEQFRPTGVHAWPYWQFEMKNAWPRIADALQINEEGRGLECKPYGAIGDLTRDGRWGACITDEYEVPGGRAQDFRDGRAYWSPTTGAHVVNGRISAKYSQMGGPESWLGFPLSNENTTPDGRGRFTHFEHGSIYWTPDTGAIPIPGDIVTEWGRVGYEQGTLGYPTGEAVGVNDGFIQIFQRGAIARSKSNENYHVHGLIGRKYLQIDPVKGPLGLPVAQERAIAGGALHEFENGVIYWSPSTGAHVVKNGPIREYWAQHSWERGELGWPTGDTEELPGGGMRQKFEHGVIEAINGSVTVK